MLELLVGRQQTLTLQSEVKVQQSWGHQVIDGQQLLQGPKQVLVRAIAPIVTIVANRASQASLTGVLAVL